MTTYGPRIDLEMIGIRLGDKLILAADETKTCIVTQLYPTEVRYDGELLSLTAAAAKAMDADDANGPRAWTFEGQTIDDRRTAFREWHQRSRSPSS